MIKPHGALLAFAGLAAAASPAGAASVLYSTAASSFSCGAVSNCVAGGNSLTLSSGADTETLSFTPVTSTVNDSPFSNISLGTLNFSYTGTPFAALSGIGFALDVSSNGGAPTLLSSGSFTTPFGAYAVEVTFAPSSGVVGGDTYQLSPGYLGTPGAYLFSSSSGAQIGATMAPAVPEPAAWAMALVGIAGIGAQVRRRRATTAFGPA